MAFVPFVESDQPTMAAFNEKFQQNFEAAVAAGLKMAVGSYVGSGTYGSTNPNKLAFPFKPEVVFLCSVSTNEDPTFAALMRPATIYGIVGQSKTVTLSTGVSWGDQDVSWYYNAASSTYVKYQLNTSGVEYFYCAFGKEE